MGGGGWVGGGWVVEHRSSFRRSKIIIFPFRHPCWRWLIWRTLLICAGVRWTGRRGCSGCCGCRSGSGVSRPGKGNCGKIPSRSSTWCHRPCCWGLGGLPSAWPGCCHPPFSIRASISGRASALLKILGSWADLAARRSTSSRSRPAKKSAAAASGSKQTFTRRASWSPYVAGCQMIFNHSGESQLGGAPSAPFKGRKRPPLLLVSKSPRICCPLAGCSAVFFSDVTSRPRLRP